MFGRRRMVTAVLTTAAVVLSLGIQASTGIVAPNRKAAATSAPPSVGTTVIASRVSGRQITTGGERASMLSGNGQYLVFEAAGSSEQTNIYVRNLATGATTWVSQAAAADGSDTGGASNGDSMQPSISDDGQIVSFITSATNIVSVVGESSNPLTLVACNVGPFTASPKCYPIASTLDGSTEPIVTAQRPRLNPSGSYITWTAGPSGSFGPLPTNLHVASFCVYSYCSNAPDVTVGRVAGGVNSAEYFDPVLDNSGGRVVFVADTSQIGSTLCPVAAHCLLMSNLSWSETGVTETSTIRLDKDPDTGTDLGDPTQGFNQIDVSDPSVTDYDYNNQTQRVAFTFSRCICQINFKAPIAAAALAGEGSWELVATIDNSTNTPTVSTKVVSVDNGGNRVDGEDGAISRDGRFVAFVTSITNDTQQPTASTVHDGLDPPGTNRQIVVRDLARKVKGALATPSASCAASPCTASANPSSGPTATFNDVFVDDTGSQVSFDSNDNDLVATDQNTGSSNPAVRDSFVRTWQPQPQIDARVGKNGVPTFDVGSVQDGASVEVNVPITTHGFGPLTFSGFAKQFARISGGPNPQDFTVVGSDCYQIYSGQDCYVTIKFTPGAIGNRRAGLSLRPDQFAKRQPVGMLRGTVGPALHVAPGDTVRTSLTDTGEQATDSFQYGSDQSMISGDGRWDVFVSHDDLAGIQNEGFPNIFVRDLADPQHTFQISQTGSNASREGDPTKPSFTTGGSPDSFSWSPSISDDGRFVSFVTESEDIVPNIDRRTGEENSETLVVCDRDPNGTMANGRPVLDQDPYACYPVPAGDVQQQGSGAAPRLSGDGTKITWSGSFSCFQCGSIPVEVSRLTNTPGGTLQLPSLPVVVPLTGIAGFKSDVTDRFDPVLTRDGSKVVYRARTCGTSTCREAVIETTLATSTTAATSVRLDVDPDDPTKFLGNEAWSISDPPATSADGSRVAFAAANGTASLVFVSTLAGGAVDRTVVESQNNNGRPAAGYFPALSGNGRYLVFLTDDSNMHDGFDHFSFGSCEPESDFAPALLPSVSISCQVVARDLTRDLATGGSPWVPSELVSSSVQADCPPNQCAADADSTNPSVDATGSEIGFDSQADDLVDVPADTNETSDTFVHTWRPTLTAAGLNFGSVAVGAHKDRTLTLTEPPLTDPADPNHIFGPIMPGSTPITGADATDYTVTHSTCTQKTLNPGASCALTVRFTPSTLATSTAAIAVDTGTNGYPRSDPLADSPFNLTGVGIAAAGALTPEPSTLDFGKQLPLKPSQPKTVTLTNPGDGPITVTDVTVQDTTDPGASTDYTVDATDCLGVLQPGQSCALTVTFVGHKTGNRDAQLVITDDTNPSPTVVDLTATVPKPKILVNPAVIAPGRVTEVSGTGFAPHRVVEVTLDGFGEQATARANGKGEFDVALVIFRNTPEGPQTVVAQTRHADKSIGADCPLLIASGTIDDLQLVTRH